VTIGGRVLESVVTPQAPIDLRNRDLRLYVAPVQTRKYARQNSGDAPDIVREHPADRPAVSLAEYVLEGRPSYHALVTVDRYLVPPDSVFAPPGRREHAVLAISDLPFRNGRAQRPLTPSFVGITY